MLHKPVLLKEAIQSLKIKKNGTYIDGTFGCGGHTKEILKKLGPHGKLYCVDKDPKAIEIGKKILDSRVHMCWDTFSNIKKFLSGETKKTPIDGILLDLGVSSLQLNDITRGFSFSNNGPLDMRMNQKKGITIAQWLQKTTENELATIIKNFGEERYAKKIAYYIFKEQKKKKIKTTKKLVEIIHNSMPKRKKIYKNIATRTFQALRIYINEELNELKKILKISLEILNTGGRLTVISFHSLEDRMVKEFCKKNSQHIDIPKGLPITEKKLRYYIPNKIKIIHRIKPTIKEVQENPRSRSAILRTLEKK